ncbi:Uncharacterised protein [Klebsiella pneumoniae]|nr:Uncharacterised protein [Klebsiella pneumoniae]
MTGTGLRLAWRIVSLPAQTRNKVGQRLAGVPIFRFQHHPRLNAHGVAASALNMVARSTH